MNGIDTTETLSGYVPFLSEVKKKIRTAQIRASLAINREVIALYWDIGGMIMERQENEGWGAQVIDRLARDLKNELPEVKGFSSRNMRRMRLFYNEYPALGDIAKVVQPYKNKGENIWPRAVAKFAEGSNPSSPSTEAMTSEKAIWPQAAAELAAGALDLPWGHNMLLIEKVKDLDHRMWYMQKTVEEGWARDVLNSMIAGRAHERVGKAVTNFKRTLPPPQSDLAQQSLKDPYHFDFLMLEEPFRERELECGLVRHLQDFLVELGVGFAFVGRQYRLAVDDEDFYVDLLFYHLKLRCYVVIELKRGAFRPEYAGQLNFYLNVVDDQLRHPDDNPTIGLILCQDKRRIVAEYALRGLDKAIGVSEYELTRTLPDSVKSSLPAIDELEHELTGEIEQNGAE